MHLSHLNKDYLLTFDSIYIVNVNRNNEYSCCICIVQNITDECYNCSCYGDLLSCGCYGDVYSVCQ